jgi:hypothetical protein
VIHGLLGASGVLLLVKIVLDGGPSPLPIALGCFAVAAVGGLVLFANHFRGRALPKGLIGVHAAVAVVGFVLLLTALL